MVVPLSGYIIYRAFFYDLSGLIFSFDLKLGMLITSYRATLTCGLGSLTLQTYGGCMLPHAQAKRLYLYLNKCFMIIQVHIVQDLCILYFQPKNPCLIPSGCVILLYVRLMFLTISVKEICVRIPWAAYIFYYIWDLCISHFCPWGRVRFPYYTQYYFLLIYSRPLHLVLEPRSLGFNS